MDTALIVLVSLLVGTFAVAFYMDWLGLWVSNEEMREEIATSKVRMQGSGQQIGDQAPSRQLQQRGTNPEPTPVPENERQRTATARRSSPAGV